MKRALITGITGQDGYYLTRYLLDLGYEVYGLIRRHSGHESELGNLVNVHHPNLHFRHGDVTDYNSVERTLYAVSPHEIYNLAAQSHVRVSFDAPINTTEINALGVLNVIEAMRETAPYAHFYQASTSEMFGNQIDSDGFQRETTPMVPVSPYGAAKLFGHNIVQQYRNSYGLFACSGILFNHESPMRGGNFVTQKAVRGAVKIVRQLAKNQEPTKLEFGNLSAQRDWGHAADYVKMMHKMLQSEKPDDYVIATGQTHTIHDMVESVFTHLGLDLFKYITVNDQHKRPEDVNFLRGDPTKAERELGWKREFDFHALMRDMITAELNRNA